jgi:uncharacterized membrane protein
MVHQPSYHTDTARLEAFSDGVFAIAITLLVLEIAVPHVEGPQSLGRALWEEWPSFLGFGISFVTIGIMWMNHHSMWRDIERFDHSLLGLNLLLLMCVSFFPFPTAVLAEYLKDPDQRLTATLFYGGTFFVTAVFFNALWLYAASGRRFIDEHIGDARVRLRTRRFALGPLLYGATLPLALASPWISLAIYVIMAVLYLLPLDIEEALE